MARASRCICPPGVAPTARRRSSVVRRAGEENDRFAKGGVGDQ